MLRVPGGSSRRRRQGGRAQIPPNRTTTTAGIFHVWLGPAWPPYLNLVLHAAAANRRATFYFVGPPLPPGSAIGNVVSLDGRNGTLLRERIATHLGVSIRLTHRKMCDLKPTWPALFPELASRLPRRPVSHPAAPHPRHPGAPPRRGCTSGSGSRIWT